MPETPQREIEKQLSDYAKRRREEVGTPAMHPATRQMLQAEAKQHFGKAAPAVSDPRVWWERFWPRRAVACALCVALGITVMLLVPHGNKMKTVGNLAKLEKTANKPAPREPAAIRPVDGPMVGYAEINALEKESPMTPTAAPAKSESVRPGTSRAREVTKSLSQAPAERKAKIGADFELAVTRADEVDNLKKRADSGLPIGSVLNDGRIQSAGSRSLSNDAQLAEGSVTESMMLAGTSAPTVSNSVKKQDKTLSYAGKDLAAQTGRLGGSKANVTDQIQANSAQLFRQTEAVSGTKASTPTAVLMQFTVAQNGNVLTVVDNDGSIYNGVMELAATEGLRVGNFSSTAEMNQLRTSGSAVVGDRQGSLNRGIAVASTQADAASLPQTQSGAVLEAQNYYFRVEGTNRSLKEKVIFTGNLLQNNFANNTTYSPINNGQTTFQNFASTQAFKQQPALQQNTLPVGNNATQTPNQGFQNNFINGRVKLGNRKESELNALSVEQ